MRSDFFKILLFILLFLSGNKSTFGQESKLYTDNGKLICDSTISISRIQLKSWSKIEDSLINNVFQYYKIPRLNLEHNYECNFILSFYIENNGSITNIRVEKTDSIKSQDSILILAYINGIERILKTNIGKVYSLTNRKEPEAINKFFLPFSFGIKIDSTKMHSNYKIESDSAIMNISNGWINFDTHVILILSGGSPFFDVKTQSISKKQIREKRRKIRLEKRRNRSLKE